jgi:hypothetical protein
MKKILCFAMLAASIVAMTCCSSDDPLQDMGGFGFPGGFNGGGPMGGASLSQACYQASSWSAGTWYALTAGSSTFAFKTPSSGGSGLVVSAASQPALKTGVSVSGTNAYFGGLGVIGGTVSGGSAVTLSSYTGGGGFGPR